ncbi:MAG TPA: hypothetical protein VGO67_11675 [Verrucomicrobiae bacterium]|jgi:hypothetical protein
MDFEPTDAEHQDTANIRTIHVFTSHEAADLAASNLNSRGIRCWINANDAGGMLPNLAAPGGVRLLVHSSDAAEATALLKEQMSVAELSALSESESGIPSPSVEVGRGKIAPVQLVIGIVAGVLLCLLYQELSQVGTRTHYHYNQDGRADEAWVYRNGHLIELMKDRNHDGIWDQWSYYKNGVVVRSDVDNNFDGKPDETWTYSDRTLVKMEKDMDFNGTPDEFCTYENGVIQEVDIRPNGAKFATERDLYQNGVLVETLREGDGHGNLKESVRYDPFHNPIGTNKLN